MDPIVSRGTKLSSEIAITKYGPESDNSFPFALTIPFELMFHVKQFASHSK